MILNLTNKSTSAEFDRREGDPPLDRTLRSHDLRSPYHSQSLCPSAGRSVITDDIAATTTRLTSMTTYPERVSLEGLEMEIFKLVSKMASPEEWAEWLGAPLEHAAAQGNLGLVDKLIGAGANCLTGWRGRDGRTLLHAAAVGGNEGVVSSLLKAGAQPDVNAITRTNHTRMSALGMAAKCGHEAVVRRLILAGADINLRCNFEERTALHEACSGGCERVAEELIMSGADITAKTSTGYTPLHFAVEEGLQGLVSTLLRRGAEKDSLTNWGCPALNLGCGCVDGVEPNLAVVETLLAAGVDVHIRNGGRSALDSASERGWVSILQALLRYGADVNSRHYLAGHSALHRAAANDQAGAVDALVEAGADVEMRSTLGRTPLGVAAKDGKTISLLALLHHGASVGARDTYGRTPMYLACYDKPEGLEVVVDLLLRWGADETAVLEDGETPADALDIVHENVYYENRTCSQDEIDRVRLLLDRAPADRAWRRRGWLVMLRARASTAMGDINDSSSGNTGLEGSTAAGGETGEGRKVARHEGGTGDAGGGRGQASRGVDAFGAENGGGGNEVLRGAVAWLVEMEPAGVFRAVLEFL